MTARRAILRMIDTFELKHHVCLRCHTRFVAESEKETAPTAPALPDKAQ